MQVLLGSTILGWAALSSAPTVWAQQGGTTVAAAQAVSFSIPAQPLSSAVDAFSRATGWQVGYASGISSAIRTQAVSGTMAPRQALQAMLAGTGVSIRITGPRSAALVNPPASAVDTAAGGGTTLQTIEIQGETAMSPVNGYVATVSEAGTKTDTPLIETPRTIAVVTQDEIAAQQAQSLRDVVRYAPGVYYSDDADFRFEPVNSRGFELGHYLDGLNLQAGTWSVPRIDPYFLQRADVLEGPASTLYGQGTPGGLVDMTSKRPTSEPYHEVELQTGSHDRIQGAFDFGGPLNKDGSLSYRLTGLGLSTGTQVDHVDEERFAVAPALKWSPDADTSLTILTSYLHDPKAGFWNLLPYQGTLLPGVYGSFARDFFVGDNNFEHFDFKQAMAGYEFYHRFNDTWSVRQNLRYNHIGLDYREVQGYSMESDGRTLDRYAYTADETLNTLAVDNQAKAEFETGALRHTVLFGLDYQYKDWDNFTRYGSAPSLDILDPDYSQVISTPPVFQNAHQIQQQLGVYAQDQIKLGGLVFSLGGREDWARTHNNNRLTDTITDQEDTAFTWHTGLLYHFDNGLAPYVSYSTSFQPTSGTTAEGDAFKPTTGQQYEIGIKYQPPGWNMLLTASAFDLTEQNVLTADPDSSHPTGSEVQTGEVRSRGINLSAVASLTPNLNLRASYSFLDTDITRSNDGYAGNDLANTPRNFASLWADYTFHAGALSGFGVGGGVRYIGRGYATNANTEEIPSYTLFDAAVHYDFGARWSQLKGLKLAVNATNLFDKKYVSYCTAAGCRWGVGRTIYGTLSYKW